MSAQPDQNFEGTAEMTVDFSTPPPGNLVDSGVLRRGMKFGQEARERYGDRPFAEVEPKLRQTWEQRGASAAWDTVRSAVQLGYETELPDAE